MQDLKGRRVAVSDQASPVKNFFAIRVAQLGLDPDQVDWRQYPQDLFGEVLRKGEVDAIAGDDPLIYTARGQQAARDRHQSGRRLREPHLLRAGPARRPGAQDPEAAAAITRAVIDAQRWTASNPDETARIFAPYVPGKVPAERVAQILRSHTHGHASTGAALRENRGLRQDLKIIKVLSANLDINKYAQAVVPNVLG